jgi:hypothetical protein
MAVLHLKPLRMRLRTSRQVLAHMTATDQTLAHLRPPSYQGNSINVSSHVCSMSSRPAGRQGSIQDLARFDFAAGQSDGEYPSYYHDKSGGVTPDMI